jgi:hypothetical protein
MRNRKWLKKLQELGLKVKSINEKGDVRFLNNHSCAYPNAHENDYLWVGNKELKSFAIYMGCDKNNHKNCFCGEAQ